MEVSDKNFNYVVGATSFKGCKRTVDAVRQISFVAKGGKIYGQEACWRLHDEGVCEQFIKSDKELSDSIPEVSATLRKYGLPLSIPVLKKFSKTKSEVNKLFELIKTKYGIDVEFSPKVYRFVGKSEVEALQRGETIVSQRGTGCFDVTLNPDLNWSEYRITFKQKPEFSVLDETSKMKENRGTNHDYFYHYEGSYTVDDVEKIEKYRV